MKPLIRSLLMLIGWLAGCFALLQATVMLDFHWDFFDWHPQFDSEALVAGLEIVAGIVAIGFLGRVTRDKASLIVSCVLCVALLALAVAWISPEPVPQPPFRSYGDAPGARHCASPVWYRGARLFVMALPAAFWALWFRWHHRSNPA